MQTINGEIEIGFNLATFPMPGVVARPTISELAAGGDVKWSWACRSIDEAPASVLSRDMGTPRVGDVAAVRVKAIGHHTRVTTVKDGKQRLYLGDIMIGVFGNRYATDALEGEVVGLDDLHMLTDAGMIGTVRSRHTSTRRPTDLEFLGFLPGENGSRLNLKSRLFRPARPSRSCRNVLLVVGTGMNTGKTTTGSRLVKALLRRGLRVAVAKLTGSVCQNDWCEWGATGAVDVRDFSDHGFPSTSRASETELVTLFETLLAASEPVGPDIVVMEVADGILQRETRMLLSSEAVRRRVGGAVLAASCSSSALFGITQLGGLGHEVIAVSGLVTNSPLFVKEFSAISSIPVSPSSGDCGELAEAVAGHFGRNS